MTLLVRIENQDTNTDRVLDIHVLEEHTFNKLTTLTPGQARDFHIWDTRSFVLKERYLPKLEETDGA